VEDASSRVRFALFVLNTSVTRSARRYRGMAAEREALARASQRFVVSLFSTEIRFSLLALNPRLHHVLTSKVERAALVGVANLVTNLRRRLASAPALLPVAVRHLFAQRQGGVAAHARAETAETAATDGVDREPDLQAPET